MASTLTASAILESDGRGSLTIGNLTRVIQEADEAVARSAIMRAVLAHAQETRSAVVLDATDRAGNSKVIVYPDGRAEEVRERVRVPETAVLPPLRLQTMPHWEEVPPRADRGSQPPSGARAWHLRFDNGNESTIWGTGLVGRAPHIEGQSPDHLVVVDDPSRTVSRTHLAFGQQQDGRLWVQDLESANGTIIHRGSERVECDPALTYTLVPGNVVELGSVYFLVSI